MHFVLLAALAFVTALAVASLIRRHALRLALVQTPNARSSHTRPTPTGGGVGIALGGAMAGVGLAWNGPPILWLVVVLSLAIATLGFLDDMLDLSSKLRFGAQLLVVGVLLHALSPLPPIESPLGPISGLLLASGVLFAGTWWINLFNFMDGIDGIAASQGIVMLGAGATLAAFGSPDAAANPVWWWLIAVAAAAAGFLVLNWAPAKIFMGDAGSNYLAFMILALALVTVSTGWVSYASWAILAAAFVSDTTVTLLRRIRNGERWFAAHRQHAFQYLARRLGSHAKATLTFIGINVLWLLPMAVWAHLSPAIGWAIVALAYLPLVAAAYWYGAGKPETR